MLPIGAYEPRWFMEPQHMNPEDAGEAFVRLGARTLVRHALGHVQAHRRAARRAAAPHPRFFAERGLGDERLWIFDVGETRALTRACSLDGNDAVAAGRSAQKVVSPCSLRTPRGSSPLTRTGASGRATTKVAPATGACVCTSTR